MKQRLLGAIVLIALAVIFVPMLLSGPAPKQTSETVNLAIPPAPDREFQNRVLPVDADAGSCEGDRRAAGHDEPDACNGRDAAAARRDSATDDGSAGRAGAGERHGQDRDAAAPAPTAKTESKSADSEPGRSASGRFYVHLGIYAATKNADDLVAALKQGGFPAFAEASDYQGKPAERVRVGPYEDRAAAEAARLRIKQVKPTVPGSVVELADDAKADAPPSALPASRAGAWAVQLGAFKTIDEANKVRDRLKSAGFVAYVDKVDAEGGTLWRVRAGPEVDRGNADKLRGRIKDKLKMDGMVVTQQ